MSNTATALTAHNVKNWPMGSMKGAAISIDTYNSAIAAAAAPGANYKHVVLGGWLKNGHASGAQTVQLRSGTTVIAQKTLAAGAEWDISTVRGIANCDANAALNVFAVDATNLPVTGNVYYGTIGKDDPIPLPFVN